MPSLCVPFHQTIVAMRASGNSCGQISRHIEVDAQSVRAYVKKIEGVTSLSTVESIDENYFSIIDTHEKAYFVGFIAGDGAIVGKTLTITLHQKDMYILEAFARQLGFRNRSAYLLSGDRRQCRFTVSRKPIIDDLERLGICPRKSLTMGNFLENIPEEFRKSAVLGYFDADGSIYFSSQKNSKGVSRRQYISIRCTHAVGTGIMQTIGIDKYSVSTFDSIPSYLVGSKLEILKFADQCYGKSSVFLSRKHERFLALFEQVQTISSPLK